MSHNRQKQSHRAALARHVSVTSAPTAFGEEEAGEEEEEKVAKEGKLEASKAKRDDVEDDTEVEMDKEEEEKLAEETEEEAAE